MTGSPAGQRASAPGGERVWVLGIRHHGPGSARSVVAELDRLRPSAVLIEGPADADPLLALAADPGMVPPVALLAYAPDEPRVSAFWPFAVFSPEWQALTWAAENGVQARFCDLPAGMVLAGQHHDADGGEAPEQARAAREEARAARERGAGAANRHRPHCGRQSPTRSGSWRRRPATTTRSAGGTT